MPLLVPVVHTYGFKPKRSTTDITALMRELITMSDGWGLSLYVSSQDVQFAFDSVKHGLMVESMLRRGVPPGCIALHMRELMGLHGVISISGAGVSRKFPFTCGGKQGGVEASDIFNMKKNCLEPLMLKWQRRGWGVHLDDGRCISHAIWADNIYLFACN